MRITNSQTIKKKSYARDNFINFGTLLQGFPSRIEVGVSKNCNLRCNCCPNTFLKKNPTEQVMPMSLFKKILTDLKSIDYDGKFQFHRYNEPMLINVERYIETAKEYLPKITTELVTNGTQLNSFRLVNLQKTPIDKIIVTQHTSKGFIDNLDKIPDDLLKNVDVRYEEELILVNRAGAIKSGATESLESPLKQPCYSINNAFIVNSNGQVPLCTDDYYSKVILGDLNKESVEKIWNSPFSQRIRQELDKGNRTFLTLCKKCDRTPHQRDLSTDLSKNNALYRKQLLLTTGSAHLQQP